MRHEQNWHNYPIPVIFLDVADLRYDMLKPLLPLLLELLRQPNLAGGVHVVAAQ